jgi:hypothetical protein
LLLPSNLPLRIRTSHPAVTAEPAALIMAEQAEVTPPELKFRCKQACWRAVASAGAQSSAGQCSFGLAMSSVACSSTKQAAAYGD